MEPITVEIDKPKDDTVVKVASVADGVEAGLTKEEIESGKKAGVLKEESAEEKQAAEKAKTEAAAKAKEDADKGKQKPPLKEWEKGVTDEEKAALDKFSSNEKALYWKQKKEKQARQKAEAERDQAKIREAYWKGKAEEAGKRPELKVVAPEKKPGDDDFLDENFGGDPNKDKTGADKPLTRADLDKIEAEKVAKAKEEEAKRDERAKQVIGTLHEQEEVFKADHEDYDAIFDHTEEILNIAHDDAKLAVLFPDKVQRRAVKSMAQELVTKMVSADKIPAGEALAPELAYELGKLHPKATNAGGDDEPGEDEDKGAKDALKKRLESQSRPSSAPLGGGNSTLKTLDEVTAEDLMAMNSAKFAAFKKKHPEVVERILRESD